MPPENDPVAPAHHRAGPEVGVRAPHAGRASRGRRSVAVLLSLLGLLSALVALTAACGDDDAPGRSSDTAPSTRDEDPKSSPATDPPGEDDTASTDPDESTTPPGDATAVLVEVASGLDSPVAFATRNGDDHVYVAEQPGSVLAVASGQVENERVLDLTGDVSSGDEQGLLGLCFSPDGDRLYVDYTDTDGDTHVVEYEMDGRVADTPTRRELLFVDQPADNHNGGHVTFGPDGMLYVGLGDGGFGGDPEGNGQNLATLFGSILRIDPDGDPYSVPDDNPLVDTDGARPEIWQWGLRNPWRFSFDRANGDLWIGDVGQNEYEEIDYAPAGDAGVNWGWGAREGLHPFDGRDRPEGARDPIYEYTHSDGGVSVTGGFVYRGEDLPQLVGAYIWADYIQGNLVALRQEGGELTARTDLGLRVDAVTSFGEDADGEIYVVSRNGSVYRLAAG